MTLHTSGPSAHALVQTFLLVFFYKMCCLYRCLWNRNFIILQQIICFITLNKCSPAKHVPHCMKFKCPCTGHLWPTDMIAQFPSEIHLDTATHWWGIFYHLLSLHFYFVRLEKTNARVLVIFACACCFAYFSSHEHHQSVSWLLKWWCDFLSSLWKTEKRGACRYPCVFVCQITHVMIARQEGKRSR